MEPCKRIVRLALLALGCLALAQPSWAQTLEQKAWNLIQQDALVIDVRTTQEYASGHLANALHIPYQQIVARFSQLEIRHDRQVVLYCRSGRRSGIATQLLLEQGYSAVLNGGGFAALARTQP